jgi:hypothetical protein
MTYTIDIVNNGAIDLLQGMEKLNLIHLYEPLTRQSASLSQSELTREVNDVYDRIGQQERDRIQNISNMATSAVWETLKNDTW